MLFPGKKHYKSLVEKESELWGKEKSEDRLSWFDSPLFCRYINLNVSGRPDMDWLDYVKQTYLPQSTPLALNLGCGHGEFDRLLIERGLAERIEAIDISEGAVEIARTKAEEHGMADRITYFVGDANYLQKTLGDKQYDAVFACMALHHFAKLEDSLQSVKSCLKPNGYFIANEFIGPERFQWTDTQLDAVNRILACFPAELRKNLRDAEKDAVHKVYRPSVKYMKSHFAFEAICSEAIVPLIKKHFALVDQKNYGGTVLHLLFEAIMGNFEEENIREHAVILRLAATMENMLLDYGVLNHDHALLIARKTRGSRI